MTTLFSEFIANNRPVFDSFVEHIQTKGRSSSPSLIPLCEKSAPKAVELRIRGNEAYNSKRLKEALKNFTESISVAPTESKELALAFGNRSAVLFSYKKYELSLLDVNRALKGNCPPSSIEKLQKRKKDCWTLIQKENKMKSSIAQNIRSTKPYHLNPIEKKLFHVNELSIDDSDLRIDFSSVEDPIWNTKFDNRFLPNVSSKVKLAMSTKWGRHWVATEDIAAGEVLSIEKFLVLTMPKSLLENCGHCSMWCEALIPCLTCTMQMYCSERCRQEAYDSYHRVECKLGVLAFLPYRQPACIALRTFLNGTKHGDLLNDLMKNPEVYTRLEGKWNCVDTPYPDDYLSMLNLNWKVYGDDLLTEKYFSRFVIAAFLFRGLRQIKFFENGRKSEIFQNFTDIELFTGFLLFHNVSLSFQYCGKIEVELMGLELEPSEASIEVGLGIATFQTLMNHSCNANTTSLMNRRRLLIYSLRPIKAGEQIFTTYGHSYWMIPKQGRAELFKRTFKMECRCIACVGNWPTLEKLIDRNDVYLTSKKKIIEKVKEKLAELQFTLQSILIPSVVDIVEFNQDNLKKALEINSEIRKYVKEPSSSVCLCENFITSMIIKTGGQNYIVPSITRVMDEFYKILLPDPVEDL